jgi:hypothetical protein
MTQLPNKLFFFALSGLSFQLYTHRSALYAMLYALCDFEKDIIFLQESYQW